MNKISKLALAALLGNVSCGQLNPNRTESDLDIFANNLISLMEMDMYDEVPDFTGQMKDLYDRRDRGELKDSDAFKTMD
jgi:hypothetical protein